LKDDDIESLNFTHVHLVNEDSSLSPPQLLRDILNGLDKKTHTLVAVQVPPPSLRSRFDAPPTTPAEGGPPTIPICRIVDRKAARDEKKAAKSKKASNPALTLKTIELNWAIDAHDLDYRLKQLKGFLEKGYRVDVMLTGKRKKRRATPEEAKHTMERVRQAIEECEGAREWKDIEGKLGGQMMVYAEGSKKEAAA
jgi:translation initiation factor IF-3